MSLKLYLIYQSQNVGYDTYDSAVVVAENEDEARDIHPSDSVKNYSDTKDLPYDSTGRWDYMFGSWAKSPEYVTAEYIGEASPHLKKGTVVCSSFNAG